MDILPANTPDIPALSQPDVSRKTRLLTLDALDGRTAAAKAVRALIAAIEDDLGGAERLSAAEHEIAQRAALAGAVLQDMETQWLSGRPLDVAAYSTLSNTQSRLLKMLGLERRPRDVTPELARYIEARATETPPPLPAAPLPAPPSPVARTAAPAPLPTLPA